MTDKGLENKRADYFRFRYPRMRRVIGFLIFVTVMGLVGWLIREEKYFKLTSEKTEKNIEPQKKIFIDIRGGVRAPGLYEVEDNTRLGKLIKLAGGLNDYADIAAINMASRLKDGQKVIIPEKNWFYKKLGVGKGPKETYINSSKKNSGKK
ncbi:SLBB domain-containing protein [Elusimicrobiota bacterium]